MTPEQFAYWLQGYVENDRALPNEQRWASINDHLKLVFQKETPDRRRRLEQPRPETIRILESLVKEISQEHADKKI